MLFDQGKTLQQAGWKKIYNTVVLSGTGDNIVKSNLQILAAVNISECYVEVLFHVVMDNYPKYDIIIGREVLQLGFGVMIDANKFTMYMNQIVNVVSNETSISILEI